MSGINLHEFNALNRKHNYFLTNNRIKGFPSVNENSIILRKILRTKTPTSNNNKIIDFNKNKMKKMIPLDKPKNLQIKAYEQSPIIDKKKQIQSNDIFNNKRYYRNSYNFNTENNTSNSNNIKQYINNSKNLTIKTNNDSFVDNHYYYKIPINIQRRIANTPDIFKKNQLLFYTYNNNDPDNEMVVLKHKGKILFNKRTSFTTPEKYLTENSREKVSELYRNTEELKRKKESVFKRKMKREPSEIRREMLRREKDKDLKEEKINIDIKYKNNTINTEDSMNRNRIKKINVNRNVFNNKIKRINNEIKPNSPKNNIPLKRITVNIKDITKNKLEKSNSNHIINSTRRINKYKVNRNSFKDLNSINEQKQEIKPSDNKNEKTNILYSKKFSQANYDFLDQGNSLQKNTRNKGVNQKIKENLNSLRKPKAKTYVQGQNNNPNNNIYTKSFDKFNNKYIFVASNKKKFIEDYAYDEPIIYSRDKKITIKIHSLPGIKEIFSGKKMTKEKLKLQRIISLLIESENQRKINYFINRKNHRTKDFYPLYSIKEEEKILNDELASKVLKTESENEIVHKPIFQRNIRMKYIQKNKNKNN